MNLESKQLQIDDCYIHYVESQNCAHPQGTIVFLHGFPENWRTWRKQIDFFSQRYRVVAPDLPGYNQSSKPSQLSFYQVSNLIEVMKRFVEFIGEGEKLHLVAHDWGGAIAWPLVAFHSQLFEKLVILNAAHPSTFTREMINNPIQRQKSDYIHELIAVGAEQDIANSDFKLLVDMFDDDKGGCAISSVELDEYIDSWKTADTLTCMLNYYRAMPQIAPRELHDMPSEPLPEMKIPNIRIEVPTLVLWGEQDLAFVPELLTGLEDYVNELSVFRFIKGNHWIHHQYSDQVNEHISEFLAVENQSV